MEPAPSLKTWPDIRSYEVALKDQSSTVYDLDVRNDPLLSDKTGPIRLNSGKKYTCVYRGVNWVVRCLTGHPPENLKHRYLSIDSHIEANRRLLTCLPRYSWVNLGIRVDERALPFIKVAFINECLSLGDFAFEHRNDPKKLAQLAQRWFKMILFLEEFRVAHGDLDLTNVLVSSNSSLELHLIDFDAMYVPGLEGQASMELGHEHFQPPMPVQRGRDGNQDRFSALVIYLSLIALSRDSSLWDSCGANREDRLLLHRSDYEDEAVGVTERWDTLIALGKTDQVVQRCVVGLLNSLRNHTVPPRLIDIVMGTRSDLIHGAAAYPMPVEFAPSSPDSTILSSSPPEPSPMPIAVSSLRRHPTAGGSTPEAAGAIHSTAKSKQASASHAQPVSLQTPPTTKRLQLKLWIREHSFLVWGAIVLFVLIILTWLI